jgi:hypothetical protein
VVVRQQDGLGVVVEVREGVVGRDGVQQTHPGVDFMNQFQPYVCNLRTKPNSVTFKFESMAFHGFHGLKSQDYCPKYLDKLVPVVLELKICPKFKDNNFFVKLLAEMEIRRIGS